MTLTTCQICGRDIKANTGLIAHHGYQRPDRGSGWQTASCFGARWRPYEVACDALPPAIKSLGDYIKARKAALVAWNTTPPRGIAVDPPSRQHGPFGMGIALSSVLRPAGFDPTAPEPYYVYNSYPALYFSHRREIERDIKTSTRNLTALRDRLAAWVAPAEKVA